MQLLPLIGDIWRTSSGGAAAIARVQQTRLLDLVEFARLRSPFYRRLHQHPPLPINKLRDLPPVTKPELMASFEDWVTDPAVTKASVAAFITDKTLVGQPYLGCYAVWTSSGTSGTPGIFLHDRQALVIYDSLVMWRGWWNWMTCGCFSTILWRGFRAAVVAATGGHFAGISSWERLRQRYPWLSHRIYPFSVLMPLLELVQKLNDVQPTLLFAYPSALLLLAHERNTGRLRIHPALALTSGEWLDPASHAQIETAFNCPVRDLYGASEFTYMAFACRHGWLHFNADWVILEPVDENYQPVPPGQPSRTVLLTNLVNRVQPLIRYDLGDSITVRPDPCPCGNPLPALRVEGRRDEILTFQTASGETIQLLPLALVTVIEETPGVQRFQLIQTAPTKLSLRLEVAPGAEEAQVWAKVARRLDDYLIQQGLPFVEVGPAAEPPRCDPVSGKFRQVWAEAEPSLTKE
jgi:phenylacetate-coenzyme A ligase PaaK-like adenylate-forming protein